MFEIGFVQPDRLWLLLIVPASMLLVWSAIRKRHLVRAVFRQQIPNDNSRINVLIPILLIGVIAFSVARPHVGKEIVKLGTRGADIAVVLDVSRSMGATDVTPDRIVAAQRKLTDLLALLDERGQADRVGLVLFAGTSYVFCPLTRDYTVLRRFVDSLSTDMIATMGSSIESGITVALQMLVDAASTSRHLLLISDGEDPDFDPASLGSRIQSANVKLNVLGVGTISGAPVRTKSGSFVRNEAKEIVTSSLNLEGLTELASAGSGQYIAYGLDGDDVQALITSFFGGERTPGDQVNQSIEIPREVGPLLLLLVLAGFAIALMARIQDVILLFAVTLIVGQPARADLNEKTTESTPLSLSGSYQAYLDGNFEQAYNGFLFQLERSNYDRRAREGKASSLYRLERYDEAAEEYRHLSDTAESGRELFWSQYNLGNALFRGGEFRKAVQAYERALEVKPGDPKTVHNLDLARKFAEKPPSDLEDSKSSNPSSQQSSSREQSSSSGETGSSSSKSNSGGSSGARASGSPQPAGPSSASPEQDQTPVPGGREYQRGQDITPGLSDQELSKAEALAWLESLSETPILFRKDMARTPYRTAGGQTW